VSVFLETTNSTWVWIFIQLVYELLALAFRQQETF
jgi:hypothetical protein